MEETSNSPGSSEERPIGNGEGEGGSAPPQPVLDPEVCRDDLPEGSPEGENHAAAEPVEGQAHIPEDAGNPGEGAEDPNLHGRGDGKKQRKRIYRRDYELALKFAKGNVAVAAAALGISEAIVHKYIEQTPAMRALYLKDADRLVIPDEISTLIRSEKRLTPNQSKLLGEAVAKLDKEMFHEGLAASGISQKTIEKLKSFDEFSANAGRFLATSFDTTHRLSIYTVLRLHEAMESLSEKELKDDRMSHEFRVQYLRSYTEMAAQIGKFYSLVMQGTQAMVMMTRKDKTEDKKKKSKPGWQND